MKQKTVDNYINTYLPAIRGGNNADAKQAVTMLIKEVERDTRYAACDEIDKLHHRVHNLDH